MDGPSDSRGIAVADGLPTVVPATQNREGTYDINSIITVQMSVESAIQSPAQRKYWKLGPEPKNKQREPEVKPATTETDTVQQSVVADISSTSSSSSSYTSPRSSMSLPSRRNMQDSSISSISSISTGSESSLPVESPKEDANLVLIPLESPFQSQDSLSLIEEMTSETPSETASSLINSDLNTVFTELDSAQRSSTEVYPSLPSRAFSWDENASEDESLMTVTWPSLPSKPFASDENHSSDKSDSYDELVFPPNSSSRNDASDSVRQGKLPARPQSDILPPLQRGQKVIHRPSTSSSGTPNKCERSHYLIPHAARFKRPQTSYFRDPGPSTSQFYEYSFQDVVEQDPHLLEQIARMEEEDRLLAEELQRIEDEDSHLAQKWQTEEIESEKLRKEVEERLTEELFFIEAQEEALRLERLAQIAFDDAFLAAAMAQQEQDGYEAEQRERERLAEQERIRQEELERERQLQALIAERNSIGAPVSVRRVSSWGGISDGDLDEITPEAVKQLKEVKELFSKSLPAFNIKKIEWIINPKLEDQFENTRRMLQNDGRPTTEVILFHGTAPGNVNSYLFPLSRKLTIRIITGGFKVGGVGGHAFAHGSSMVPLTTTRLMN
jgi:hypothetical protein